MPRASWCRPEIYELFDRWRRTCLIEDGALFSDAAVWTDAHLSALQTTLGSEALGEGSFFDKLRAQLADHPPEVRQLGVEIVYLEHLGEHDTRGATKRDNLGALSDLLPRGVTIPPELTEILDGGIASYGPGKAYRNFYARFLLKLGRAAKRATRDAGRAALQDPWRFRDLVDSVRTSTDGLEANAVLHACFPDEFDVMISRRHRDKLLKQFGDAPLVVAATDEDRKLLAVREVLRTQLPEPVDEPYDDIVRPLWDEAASPEWDELVRRMLPALRQGADAGGPDEAGQPEPDADLLERLQHALAAPVGWEDALGQAAVRAAALGVAVPRWGLLVDALRGAVASLPDEHEDAVTGAPAPFALAPVTVELANELLMPQGPLQRIVDLLQRRRQVILYGPPGTGKTWLARRLARHAFSGADVRLVQFHPSYTYEDFVEGYRPRTRDGALTYELIRGTLRELAAQAMDQPERPHLVIIDEINRGNLPKIFGELYFLLEYRDEPLRLQYSSDVEFRLPPNLYFIGTMNTADRSIALLDAALRRRFAFVELSPLRVPVDGLLQRWLERHGLEPEPHVLLDTLNTLLLEADGDRDLAIGPSYFLNREGTAPDLETIWEYDILPLLAERFYGTEYDVEARFGLAAVRAEAARRADMEP